MRKARLYLPLIVACLATPAAADVWDVGTETDNFVTTDNELVHGSDQVHDLGALPTDAPDVDWYLISLEPHTSWEFVVDGTTGDVAEFGGPDLIRADHYGTVLQEATPVSPLGATKSLRRIVPDGPPPLFGDYLLVRGADCGIDCTANDQYRIRAMETTISVPRFNNSASQRTILMAQNLSDAPVQAKVFFWSGAGTLLHTVTLDVAAKELEILSLASVPELALKSGSVTIAHDAPYGQLNVKAVAVEPDTGFSFDTPGLYRPL